MDRELLKNSLNNAGFTDVQSETLSHITAQLATKEDLRILRAEIRSVESRLLAQIEKSARETQAQMTRTMVGLIISLATIFTLLDLFID